MAEGAEESKTPFFDTLKIKHQAFVLNYLEERVSTTAYQKAFSTEKRPVSYNAARASAPALLANPSIKAAIHEKLTEIWERKERKIGSVFDELCALAFSDIKDVVTITEDGNMAVKPLEEIDSRAVKKIKIRRERTSKPTESKPYEEISDIIEIEMYDKRGALSELAEIESMKTLKVEGEFSIVVGAPQKPDDADDE